MTQPLCRCGKPSHILYGSRCEDCWVLGNVYIIGYCTRYRHRGVSGIGDDTDSQHISSQGPRGRRWTRGKR